MVTGGTGWICGGWGAGPLFSLPRPASAWWRRLAAAAANNSCCCCFLCINSFEEVRGNGGGGGGGWFLDLVGTAGGPKVGGGGGGGALWPGFPLETDLWSAGQPLFPPPPLPPFLRPFPWLGEPVLPPFGHKGVNSMELEDEAMHTSTACTGWIATSCSLTRRPLHSLTSGSGLGRLEMGSLRDALDWKACRCGWAAAGCPEGMSFKQLAASWRLTGIQAEAISRRAPEARRP